MRTGLRSCWPGVRRTYADGEALEGHDVVPELAPREIKFGRVEPAERTMRG